MKETIIDLSRFLNGVTLDVNFNFTGSVTPFIVFITTEDKKTILYSRMYDKPVLTINLPKHSAKVILFTAAPIKTILMGPLRIYKLDYQHNKNIITPRDYKFSEIKTEYLPYIPDQNGIYTNQPARFMPPTGLKQLSTSVLKTYPQPTQEFVDTHEDGHYYYGQNLPPYKFWKFFTTPEQKRFKEIHAQDEMEADRYAFYNLINKGYNFSNLWDSVNNYLSDNEETRQRRAALKSIIINEHKKLGYEWN